MAKENTSVARPMLDLINFVENLIASTYKFHPLAQAQNHLVNRRIAEDYICTKSQRAAVIFNQHNDEIFIGIYLGQDLQQQIRQHHPMHKVDTHNLDCLCAVTEEISHFHLLLQRLHLGLHTSKVELEFQAELDKLVVASHLLHEQVDDPHIWELTRYLFDVGIKEISDISEYRIANNWAQRIWLQSWQELKSLPNARKNQEIKKIARGFYQRGLAGKYAHMNSLDFLADVA